MLMALEARPPAHAVESVYGVLMEKYRRRERIPVPYFRTLQKLFSKEAVKAARERIKKETSLDLVTHRGEMHWVAFSEDGE